MTRDEATKRLDWDSLLKSRARSRLFGNIDTLEPLLPSSAVFDLCLISSGYLEIIHEALNRPSPLAVVLANRAH